MLPLKKLLVTSLISASLILPLSAQAQTKTSSASADFSLSRSYYYDAGWFEGGTVGVSNSMQDFWVHASFYKSDEQRAVKVVPALCKK